ncbi:MAG TPA: hypothetical protein VHW01_00135 [Polyangiaceae bacterium]|jgi:hypothetical protein|nr:hypothetical protein [Polyangiaceae bacterium]
MPAEPTSLGSARATLLRLVQAASEVESSRGGGVALARRRYELTGAQATEAWLDWLPDFSVALRRQIEQDPEPGVGAARWRVDLQAQAALSLQKLAAVATAKAAQTKAHAELDETSRALKATTLFSCLALYVAERRSFVLQEHLAEMRELAESPSARGAKEGEALLVEARVDELRSSLAELERERLRAARRLRLALPLAASGLDPQLDLTAMLGLVREVVADSLSRPGEVEQADLALAQQRLQLVETRRWYVPELRAAAVALLPKSDVTGSGSAFHLESVTGELTLGLRLHPGLPFSQAAAAQGVLKSKWLGQEAQWTREQTEDQARISRDALTSLWTDQRGLISASAGFADVSRRFARGERSAAELAESSRSLTTVRLEREAIFEQAVVAQIVLTAASGGGGPMLSEVSATASWMSSPLLETGTRQPIEALDADKRCAQAVEVAPSVKAARAEAARAVQAAGSESYRFRSSLEAGVLYPFYQRASTILELRPELGLAGAGLAPIAVREASLLGRWSVDVLGTGRSARALEREAALRQTEAELTRKRFLWAELAARLELAHARTSNEHAAVQAAFFRQNLEQQRRSLAQGTATEEDVRSAELADHAAVVTGARAAARLQAAELTLAQKLGASRGSQITITETPAAVEAWARDRFIPEQGLFGFESALSMRVAELQVEYADAQVASLASPARSVTLTAEATQGLRGGGYSFTLGIGVALDPPREPTKLVRAAELAGAEAGRLAAASRELNERRTLANQTSAEARDLLADEANIQRDIGGRMLAVRAEQAETAGENNSLKQRELAALEAALLESEARALEDEERRSTAALQALALGAAEPRANAGSRSATLPQALFGLTEADTGVVAADAAAREGQRANTTPVATGLHLAGPFVAGSYAVTRVAGPSTTSALQANPGLGAALGLDEAAAFVASARLLEAAKFERRASRKLAVRGALHEIGLAWTARELARLSVQEETEARRYLEDSVLPRFKLGMVATAAVSAAQDGLARAVVRRSSAEARLSTQLAMLAAQGAPLGEAVLDEYAAKSEALLASDMTASVSRSEASFESGDPAQLAAQARRGAARSEAAATALRVVSPVNGLVEFRPAKIQTESGRPGAEQTVSSSELLWVVSLIVPFRPKVLGAVAVESARARLSDDELAATTRERHSFDVDLRSELYAGRRSYAAALQARLASEAALAELERRFRAGEDQTTQDDVVQARRASLDAQRALVEAEGAALETHAQVGAEGLE